jgi:hypothetical protein
MEDRAYLLDESGRVKLFLGLGSAYAPHLDQLKRCERLFLYEGPYDLDILRAWAATLGMPWPQDLVCWKNTKPTEARVILFDELRREMPGLKGISLQDRDNYPVTETKQNLTFGSLPLFKKGFGLRRWRRRNIENYLLHPAAIARAAGQDEAEVRGLFESVHGLAIPADFTSSNCPQTLAHTDGKEIITKNARSVLNEFGVNYLDIAKAMSPDEIPDDAKELVQQLIDLCKP